MKRKILLIIGVTMLLFAASFIAYALNNPQVSFPWSNVITYTIYLVYVGVMIGCFVLSRVLPPTNRVSRVRLFNFRLFNISGKTK